MIPRALPVVTLVTLTAALSLAALRPTNPLSEHELVERGLVLIRLDPKAGAAPGECDDLASSDLSITVDRRAAAIKSVEHVPRPLRHWLLIDVSESAEERRIEAKRSAAQYIREVMAPGLDVAAIVTVDEDPILTAGPTADPAQLARDVEGVAPGGWSALRDGLDHVLRQIEGDRHEQLVLFWTDGEDQSSLVTQDDLYATLARAPNTTVFPIALLPPGSRFPPPPLTGATFTEVARRSGGEVFMSSDPKWLDRVRGWIGRRFTVAFTPPPPREGSSARRGLDIAVREKRCQVTLLPDPFARPDPVAGAAPPAPAAWVRLLAGSREPGDAACAKDGSAAAWSWPLRPAAGGLSGCMLDFVRSPGPIIHDRGPAGTFEFQAARVASRQVQLDAPELTQLPASAAGAFDSIAGRDLEHGAVSPFLIEGNALLAQRARIATSLFATRADYRDFALARLQRFADDELRSLEREFARAFPGLPPAQIRAVARASRAGRRALEAAATPTDADLVRVLAAWIRDVPAADLLRELEERFVDARIRSGRDRRLPVRWAAAARRLRMPSRVRIEAPLVLVHDQDQDVVGFVRVVLPRPERYRPPDPRSSQRDPALDARLPLRPFALELVDALAAQPGIGETLSSRSYRCESIAYRPSDSVDRQDPMEPFRGAHVTLSLAAPPEADAPRARLVVTADVSVASDGLVAILNFSPTVTGDAALEAALAKQPWSGRPDAH